MAKHTLAELATDTLELVSDGRWPEIISSLASIDPAFLDGRHHECPKCGGTDRFRAFDDFANSGGMICNQCFDKDNGDGLAALMWLTGNPFRDVLSSVATHVGMAPSKNGKPKQKSKRPFEEQARFLKADQNVPYVCEFAECKPPITVEACLSSEAAFVLWPAKSQSPDQCLAFPASRDNGKPCAYTLFRCDGKPFAAAGKLQERKSHNLAGSKDGWHFIGGRERFDTASHIVVCEGLPDALAVHSILPDGWAAVTNACGAKSCPPTKMFADKFVVIILDADQPGVAGSKRKAKQIAKHATETKIGTLPYEVAADHGKDLRDFLNDGNTFDDFRKLVDEAEWILSDDKPLPVANGIEEWDNDGNRSVVPLHINDVAARIFANYNGQPYRVGNSLFAYDGGDEVRWLSKSSELFSCIGSQCDQPPQMFRNTGCHGKDEVFAALQHKAQRYQAIEQYPHHPLIDGHFYACEHIESGPTDKFDEFLSRFCPASRIDGDLLRAFVMTALWGARSGSRPLFVFTASGRGYGKTAAVTKIGHLTGGTISLQQNDDMEKFKNRLLNSDGLSKRIVLMDNAKGMKVSSSDFEALITADQISGWKLYHGDGSRPNSLLWTMTINGANLSTDLAQRAVIIKLAKPKFDARWEEQTREFIDANRNEIIGGVLSWLQREPTELHHYTRWAAWESAVLSKLPCPADIQNLISERQDEANVEEEESQLLEDTVIQFLERLGFDVSAEQVYIPSKTMADVFNSGSNQRLTTTKVTRLIKQMIEERSVLHLTVAPSHDIGRGFLWTGDEWTAGTGTKDDILKQIDNWKFKQDLIR